MSNEGNYKSELDLAIEDFKNNLIHFLYEDCRFKDVLNWLNKILTNKL